MQTQEQRIEILEDLLIRLDKVNQALIEIRQKSKSNVGTTKFGETKNGR